METALIEETVLTVREVADLTRISKSSVLREIAAGEFDAMRLGPGRNSIRVKKASVDRYLARRAIRPATGVHTA